MLKVPLVGKGRGQYAIVDDSDTWVLDFRWKRKKGTGTTYAYVSSSNRNTNNLILHRVILGLGKGDPAVDHIDGNGLNCQRSNLRLATSAQNHMNQRKTRGTSKYKGVYWSTNRGKWQAEIKRNSKTINLGRYSSEIEAAKAYDRRARELFGEYARLNFPDGKITVYKEIKFVFS